MPAFQISRLREQLRDLSVYFQNTSEYKHRLEDLMMRYGDMGYRSGLEVRQGNLIPTYHLNPIVLRYLEKDLLSLSQGDKSASLALIDVLWQDKFLEPRLLAIFLLGQIDLMPPEPVIERINSWAKPNEFSVILEHLFITGSARLRKEMTDYWLKLVDTWLSHSESPYRDMGLNALLAWIKDADFDNLPSLFRLLSPLLQNLSEPMPGSLAIVLEELAKRSPVEMAYYLRQQLTNTNKNPVLQRLVRRCLQYMTPATQESFRDVI